MRSLEVPVLIVGAGPSGLMASLLLEQMGIETMIVDRRPGPKRAPAAHVVNARTLEICRAAGVDMRAAADAAQDPADAGYACWVTKLGGHEIGRLPYEQQGDEQLAVTPTPLRNISQNRFEPLLLDALARMGRAPHWNRRCLSSEQSATGVVISVLADADAGSDVEPGADAGAGGDTLEVHSRYVIAADGAGSPIRRSLGIEVVGPERIQSFIMVHLATSLRDRAGTPPGVLFFVCDPSAVGGAFISHDLDRECVYMHPFDAETESIDDYPEARCADLVRNALADPDLAFTIEAVGAWEMTAQVADAYRSGAIFLVGDSAHRFPPTGGLGLNTGVQDAHNLAWKIAAVIRGDATSALLDSYESERRPVAANNAEQSLTNAFKMIEVPVALGTTDASEASRERMHATLADADGLAAVAAAIENQAEHFDMPGLQLGFAYEAGAVLREAGEQFVPPSAPRAFVPSGAAGHRVPHAWLSGERGQASLLDWVPLDRFVVLAGPDGERWMDAAAALIDDGLPLVARRVTADLMPEVEAWLHAAGIERGGALLVRPDQHVAWRSPSAAEHPADALKNALAVVLAGGARAGTC